MKESRVTKICPLCKRPKRPSAYPRNPDGTRGGVCIECVKRREATTAARPWDWKLALLKTLRQGHAGEQFRYVTVQTLHVLFQVQGGVCAVSGRTFELPPGLNVKFGTGWRTLQKRADHPGLTPELVRSSVADPWEPGNLALICHDLLDLYTHSGSLYELLTLMERTVDHGLHVPTRTEIAIYADPITETENESDLNDAEISTHRGPAAGICPVRVQTEED